MRLYHRTTRHDAAAILRSGFRDARSASGRSPLVREIWLSEQPPASDGDADNAVLAVDLDLPAADLAAWAWEMSGPGPGREYLVPPEMVDRHTTDIDVVWPAPAAPASPAPPAPPQRTAPAVDSAWNMDGAPPIGGHFALAADFREPDPPGVKLSPQLRAVLAEMSLAERILFGAWIVSGSLAYWLGEPEATRRRERFATPALERAAAATEEPGEPEFYTVAEVAALLRLGERAVREALIRGELPGVKIGGSWRIERELFRRWCYGQAFGVWLCDEPMTGAEWAAEGARMIMQSLRALSDASAAEHDGRPR